MELILKNIQDLYSNKSNKQIYIFYTQPKQLHIS